MVKKLQKMADKKKASAGGLMDSELAQSVKDSAQQIWLAGLGAFGKAQEGGTKVFDTLVREGSSLQRKTQAAAEGKLGEVTDRMTSMANDVGSKAGQRWDKLESIFEERVAKALNRMGVPARKDVDALIQRIDALSAQVAQSPAQAEPKRQASVKKAAKRAQPAAKKVVKKAVEKVAEPVAKAVKTARKAATKRAPRKSAA